MSTPARLALVSGLLGLSLTVINQLSAPQLEPSLQRSSALAALLSVGLLLVAALWTRAVPAAAARAPLQGQEGLLLRSDLPAPLAAELDWGSRLVLTATPAAVLLLLWDGQVLLRRGLCGDQQQAFDYRAGPIGLQAMQRAKAIHLVDLKHYPGRDEFDGLLADVPSVVIQPLGSRGLLLVGGWSARCFSRSDQLWIEGWAQRLTDEWLLPWSPGWSGPGAEPGSNEPASPVH